MKVEFEPSKVIFSTLPGKLHIVAEMVSKVQCEEFWMLFRIMSEEQKLCSPIQGKGELYHLKGRGAACYGSRMRSSSTSVKPV